MTAFEEVLVFSKGNTANGSKRKMNYYPQGLVPTRIINKNNGSKFGSMAGKRPGHKKETIQEFTNFPHDVLKFESEAKPKHPTQKPVALFEYLIKTYTKKEGIVLDNCMGSGTTAVACMNTGRNYIGFELDKTYYDQSLKRIKNHTTQTDIFDVLEGTECGK